MSLHELLSVCQNLGLVQIRLRSRALSHLRIGDAAVVVRGGIPLIETDRLVQIFDRAAVVLHIVHRRTAVQKDRRVIRIEPDSLVIVGDCPSEFAFLRDTRDRVQ